MDEFTAIKDFLLADRRKAGFIEGSDAVLAEIGCLLAVDPGSDYLDQVVHDALTDQVSYTFLETALIHAIGYLGILPTQTAHHRLRAVAQKLGVQPATDNFPPIPRDRQARVELGKTLYGRFDPDRAATQAKKFADISPVYYPRALEISGLTLRSDELPLRQRQIMTVAMLACSGIEPQLQFHIGVALDKGVTQKELAGILLFVQVYAGMPRANMAANIVREVIKMAGH